MPHQRRASLLVLWICISQNKAPVHLVLGGMVVFFRHLRQASD